MRYRRELKFLVCDADLEILRKRICHLTKPDIHQTNTNSYLITSLYFDDPNNNCHRETIDGVNFRHKYRLRLYNHNSNLVKLERKSKLHCMTSKLTVPINSDECALLMQGVLPSLQTQDSNAKKQILCDMKLAFMQPKCIVQYRREAFVYPVGNVRITFDQNLCASSDILSFTSSHFSIRPILPCGQHILEVKYDDILPGFLADALEIDQLWQTSFSKYGYARTVLD